MIFVKDLANKLCIYFKKNELPETEREWEYVTEMIKWCDWKSFYEIVEFIGKDLIRYEVATTENYIRFDEEQELLYGENKYRHDFEGYESYNHEFLWIEEHGYQAYKLTVNSLFLENHIMYELKDFGKIISLLDEQEETLNIDVTGLEKKHESYIQEPIVEVEDHTHKKRFSEIDKLCTLAGSTDLLNEQYIKTVETGADLFAKKRYLETMQVLFPSIEYILNSMLKKAGQNPENDYRGFKDKVKWLEEKKLLPPHVSPVTYLAEGRNKTAHGNLSIEDEGLAEAMCLVVIRYLSFLIRKPSLK